MQNESGRQQRTQSAAVKKAATFANILTLCGVLAACNGGAVSRDDTATENSRRDTAGQRRDDAPTVDGTSPRSTPTGAAKAPVSQDVDLQANHPNGTVLRLSNITFSQDSIAVSLSVTNGHKDEIRLNDHAMLLRDNLGNRYNLSPPPQNPDVRVPSGNTLDGKFIFLGRLNPAATSLTLTTNDRYGGNSDYTNQPKITINEILVRK